MIFGFALLLAASGRAGAIPRPIEPPAAATSIVLPAGTAVRLITVGPIHSRSVNQGQRFALAIAEDVTVGSHILIPRGTPAVGEVEAVAGTGMFGKGAKLVLRPLFVDIAGERVNLVGVSRERGSDGTTAAAITTVLTGGLGLFITGKSAVVPSGAPIFGSVRSDVVFRLAAVSITQK